MATRTRPSDFSVEVTCLEGEPVPNSPYVNSIKIEFKMIRHVRNDSGVIVYRDELIRDSWSELRALFPASVFKTKNYIEDYLIQTGLTQSEATLFIETKLFPPLNEGGNERCSRLSIVVIKNVTLAQSVRWESIQKIDITGDCAICIAKLSETPEIHRLPCKHLFHPACIEKWLKERSYHCPVCRSPMPIREDALTSRTYIALESLVPFCKWGCEKISNVNWRWMAKAVLFAELGRQLFKS